MQASRLAKTASMKTMSEVRSMKFIYVKDPEVAKKLIDLGYEQLTQSKGYFIFKNDPRKSASYGHFRGVVFSNTMFL